MQQNLKHTNMNEINNLQLVGPMSQLVTMAHLNPRGPLKDKDLTVIKDAGILIKEDKIQAIGSFDTLKAKYERAEVLLLKGKHTCLPGFIDAHTHICFGGSRTKDYALRNSGKSYLEIAKSGGGIWDTVTKTRALSQEELAKRTAKLANRHLKNGTTTLEVKSGYGLSIVEELKMLRAIKEAQEATKATLISTCLAAHTMPNDFEGSPTAYLQLMGHVLLPQVKAEGLADRVDAFIEESAFSAEDIAPYFKKAKQLGFDITVHADQFSTGGSKAAIDFNALSADHLEASTQKEIGLLAQSETVATVLPGASLGLGLPFAPARKLLDAGAILAIASDHNPGSAPMGDLLTQAALLGAYEKLTHAEVLAGLTARAAAALKLTDRGQLKQGFLADFILFHTDDYSEILYNQGNLKPCVIFKDGKKVVDKHG
jgi:imidazolonepropionase